MGRKCLQQRLFDNLEKYRQKRHSGGRDSNDFPDLPGRDLPTPHVEFTSPRRPSPREILIAVERYSYGSSATLVCSYFARHGIEIPRYHLYRWVRRIIDDNGNNPWEAYKKRERKPRSKGKRAIAGNLLGLLRKMADRPLFKKERQRWQYWPPYEIRFWGLTRLLPPRIVLLGIPKEDVDMKTLGFPDLPVDRCLRRSRSARVAVQK